MGFVPNTKPLGRCVHSGRLSHHIGLPWPAIATVSALASPLQQRPPPPPQRPVRHCWCWPIAKTALAAGELRDPEEVERTRPAPCQPPQFWLWGCREGAIVVTTIPFPPPAEISGCVLSVLLLGMKGWGWRECLWPFPLSSWPIHRWLHCTSSISGEAGGCCAKTSHLAGWPADWTPLGIAPVVGVKVTWFLQWWRSQFRSSGIEK